MGGVGEANMAVPIVKRVHYKSAFEALSELKTVKGRLLGAGIAPDRILLDPGFGFGTTFLEDQSLWGALPEMPALLDWPAERFCIGVSRKRFVARKFGVSGNGPLDQKTAEMHKDAANMGYRVFRAHSFQGN
jgi:dihydropteroate synthase